MELGDNEGAPHQLSPEGGAYASEETLHSSLAFLQDTLTSMGMCEYIDLMSNEPADVVSTCNTIYGLLLQHQRDAKFKEQLKQELQRARVELHAADKERSKLEGRLDAKEREIGALTNKNRAGDDARKEEVTRARREAEDLQKRLLGCERRVVQMQHEMKRREREYEKLQERLSHYLADKKRNENAALAMAGQLTQGTGVGAGYGAGAPARGGRSDEGLKAVVTAYEGKQTELLRENKDLRSALTALQGEYKEALNAAVAKREADAAAGPVVEESFLKEVPHMSADELKAELSSRLKALQRRLANLSWRPGVERGDQHLAADLTIARGVIRDQEALITGVLGALRGAQETADAQHRGDAKALVQRYQAQLAAAEADLQREVTAAGEKLAQETSQLRADAQAKLHAAESARDEAMGRAQEAEELLAKAELARTRAMEDAARSMETRLAAAVADAREKAGAEMSLMAEESTELNLSLKREQAALRAETGALRERLIAEKAAAAKALTDREEALSTVTAQIEAAEQRAFMRAEDSFKAQLQSKVQAIDEIRAQMNAALQSAQQDKEEVVRAAEQDRDALVSDLAALRRRGIEERAAFESQLAAVAEASAHERTALESGAAAQRDAALTEVREEAEKEATMLRRQIVELQGALESLRQESSTREAALGKKVHADRAALMAKAESDFSEEREELIRKAASLQKELTAERATAEKLRSAAQCAGDAALAAQKYEDMTVHYKELMGKYAPGLGAGLFLERAVGRQAAVLAGVEPNAGAAAVRGRRAL